jgi:uracil phosphoribosyltransferase
MAGMAMSLRVVVPPHPLIAHWLTLLRDSTTPPPLYATALAELGRWLTYEAVRDWLPQQAVDVQTALAPSPGTVVDGSVPLLALPVLPAGLGLWEGARSVLPAAALAPLWREGGQASESAPSAPADPVPAQQALAQLPLAGLPPQIGARVGVLVFLPELADPALVLQLLSQLTALGVEGNRLRLITGLASAPALSALGSAHPLLTVYCAGIDATLNPQGQIVPGFGDACRRFTGIDAVGCLG